MDLYRCQKKREKYRNNLAKFNIMYKIELTPMHNKIISLQEKANEYNAEITAIDGKLVPFRRASRAWAKLARYYAKHYPHTHTDNTNMSQPMRKEIVSKKECVRYLKYKEKPISPEPLVWDENAKEAADITRQDEDYFSPFSSVMTLIVFPESLNDEITTGMEECNDQMPDLNMAKRRKMIEAKVQAIAKKDSVAAQFVASLYAQYVEEKEKCIWMLQKKEVRANARAQAWNEVYQEWERRFGYYGRLEAPVEPHSPLFSEDSVYDYDARTEDDHFGSGSDSVSDF